MQLILTQDVEHLGKAGQLVTVRAGYGRNYLLPQGLAISATTRNKNRLEHERRAIEARVAKNRAASQEIADRLNGITLRFERRVGENDKLFGSVSSHDLAEQLRVAGHDVDHRKIGLKEPIKALGKYEVEVKLSAGVNATLKFLVVAAES